MRKRSQSRSEGTSRNNYGRDTLPTSNTHRGYRSKRQDGEKMTMRGIKPAGESGRRGFHPWHFLRIAFRSTCTASLLCNFLWPVVPAAIAVRCEYPLIQGDKQLLLEHILPNQTMPCEWQCDDSASRNSPLTMCKTILSPPRYSPESSQPHFHACIHCYGSVCKSHWLCWPGACPQATSCSWCPH